MPYKWYLSAAALRKYMDLAGIPDDDGGDAWGRAERELMAFCDAAWLVVDNGDVQIWRTGTVEIAGRLTRLEMTVSTRPRPEGPLPQLIRVRDKGYGGGARKRPLAEGEAAGTVEEIIAGVVSGGQPVRWARQCAHRIGISDQDIRAQIAAKLGCSPGEIAGVLQKRRDQ